ncbi:hypothetical protein KM043_015875 [Ampulex compressa]|nr:hypothetical protein KM043_015875 [Ampulex compressa]
MLWFFIPAYFSSSRFVAWLPNHGVRISRCSSKHSLAAVGLNSCTCSSSCGDKRYWPCCVQYELRISSFRFVNFRLND